MCPSLPYQYKLGHSVYDTTIMKPAPVFICISTLKLTYHCDKSHVDAGLIFRGSVVDRHHLVQHLTGLLLLPTHQEPARRLGQETDVKGKKRRRIQRLLLKLYGYCIETGCFLRKTQTIGEGNVAF